MDAVVVDFGEAAMVAVVRNGGIGKRRKQGGWITWVAWVVRRKFIA